MSDIKVGDLVVIVRPKFCCGDDSTIGKIFTVTGFRSEWHCLCGAQGKDLCVMRGDWWRCHISRVRKIPPLSDPETTETREELTA